MKTPKSKKNSIPKKYRLSSLSLHPLKVEEALRLFMQVDPVKVERGMKRLRGKRGQNDALPIG
jgi:hypothetical protein